MQKKVTAGVYAITAAVGLLLTAGCGSKPVEPGADSAARGNAGAPAAAPAGDAAARGNPDPHAAANAAAFKAARDKAEGR